MLRLRCRLFYIMTPFFCSVIPDLPDLPGLPGLPGGDEKYFTRVMDKKVFETRKKPVNPVNVAGETCLLSFVYETGVCIMGERGIAYANSITAPPELQDGTNLLRLSSTEGLILYDQNQMCTKLRTLPQRLFASARSKCSDMFTAR